MIVMREVFKRDKPLDNGSGAVSLCVFHSNVKSDECGALTVTPTKDYRSQYTYLTEQIEDVRQAKTDLLKNADLPLEGLSVEDGELLYNGHKWDSISGAEQLIVATSIVRKLNPDCGFVLLDKLEQMDTDTLDDFGKWLEAQGLQAIATRVSTGDECSIIIEDGRSMDNDKDEKSETKTWKAGAF